MSTAKDQITETVEIDYGGATDPGVRRQVNEDAYGRVQTKDVDLFLIADGMGGPKSGSVASNLVISTIRTFLENKAKIEVDDLRSAIKEANKILTEQAHSSPELAGMGSTIVGLGFLGEKLVVVNVGNSRAYAIRGNDITQITVDHTLYQELLASGAIEQQPFLHKPVGHMLTRSLGTTESVEVDCFIADSNPEIGDVYVLCSDGLHDVVSPAEILENSLIFAPQEAADALIKLGRERGAIDNLSVIVIGLRNGDIGRTLSKEVSKEQTSEEVTEEDHDNIPSESTHQLVQKPYELQRKSKGEEEEELDDEDLDIDEFDDFDEELLDLDEESEEKEEDSDEEEKVKKDEHLHTESGQSFPINIAAEIPQVGKKEEPADSADTKKLFNTGIEKEPTPSEKLLGSAKPQNILKPIKDGEVLFGIKKSSQPPLSALIMIFLVLGLLVGSFFASGGGSTRKSLDKGTALNVETKTVDSEKTEPFKIESEQAETIKTNNVSTERRSVKDDILKESTTKVRTKNTNFSDLDLSRLKGDELKEVQRLVRDVYGMPGDGAELKPGFDPTIRAMFDEFILAVRYAFAVSKQKIAMISESNENISKKLEELGKNLDLNGRGNSETLLQESTP